MNRSTLTYASIASIAIIAAGAMLTARVTAGPLDPPAGAVSPTYKTLAEVEPRIAINSVNTPGDANNKYIIRVPGSYYLTDDIPVDGVRHGIRITVSQVTIDLNGFRIVDQPFDFNRANDAIYTDNGISHVTVKNGSVSGFDGGSSVYGVLLNGVTHARVENLTVSNIGGRGIQCGDLSIVSGCTVSDCGGDGIMCGSGLVDRCAVRACGSYGILAGPNCIIRSSTSEGCTGVGIGAGANCTVTECSTSANGATGILVGSDCVVRSCTTNGNLYGIACSYGCLIAENVCSENTGAGLRSEYGDCRIEGNTFRVNLRGLYLLGTGNIVVRNVASGNSVNWYIAAGNSVAPIVSAGTNALLINGNTFAGSLGSTDANANFTY